MRARTGVVFILVLLVVVGVGAQSWRAYVRHREAARALTRIRDLGIAMDQGEKIIRAIQSYEREHRRPPGSLNKLKPKYLQTIPGPGPAASDGKWCYLPDDTQSGSWSLVVWCRPELSPSRCPFCRQSFLVFYPEGEYPKEYGGGQISRMGKWAYYAEH